MAVSIITILNSSNLFTDQIVYAQTVIDTLKVGNATSAIAFNNLTGEIYVSNGHNDSISVINTNNRTDIIAERADNFGSPVATGDFNKDGYKDLAIGVPLEDIQITPTSPNIKDVGAVNVIYGSSLGLNFLNNQIWYQGYNGILDAPEPTDLFGRALAAGDFNKDGTDDLAIGVPGEDVGNIIDAGRINVIYGSSLGLNAKGNQIWHQNNNVGTSGISGSPQKGDQFGSTLAAGDFKKDGYKDLAIGVPGEDIELPAPGKIDVGVINVIYGSTSGLSKLGNTYWYQDSKDILDKAEPKDRFGSALAAGNFGKDSADDLAIGVPLEDIQITPISPNIKDVGAVNVIYGSSSGLNAINNQFWHQNKDVGNNGLKDPLEKDDQFGSALAAGNFGKDSADDLAIGVPGEDFLSVNAGMINVIYGSNSNNDLLKGLVKAGNQIWHQGNNIILGAPQKDDGFGSALAAGNFGKDSADDIAIGVPGEGLEPPHPAPAIIDVGVVNVIYGSNSIDGLVKTGNNLWYQGNSGILDKAEPKDRFGSALAAGNFGYGTADDLAIGVPLEDIQIKSTLPNIIDAGAVNVIYGSSSGLNAKNNQFGHQEQREKTGFMYVANQGTNSVTVLNTTSNTVVGSPILVGENPVGIAFDPVHNRMYVANQYNNTVSVIDITTNTVVGSPIPDGRNNPVAIAFDPVHNRMYVANELINTVLVIDITTNTVVGSISVVGNSQKGIAFDPVHNRMYVTNFGNNTVSVIDTNTMRVVGLPIPLGGNSNPWGIAFDPVHNRMYETNLGNNTVSVIDTNTNSVVGPPIPVGHSPYEGIAFDPLHDRMYIGNLNNNTISVIDTNNNTVSTIDGIVTPRGIAFASLPS